MTEITRAARIDVLIDRLDKAGQVGESDRLLLMELRQMVTRLDNADREFSVTSVVSYHDGRGLVDMTFHGGLAQIEPVKAREMAWMLLECAAVTEAESMVMRFMRETFHLDQVRGAQILNAFRRFRDPESSLLVGTDGKTPPH